MIQKETPSAPPRRHRPSGAEAASAWKGARRLASKLKMEALGLVLLLATFATVFFQDALFDRTLVLSPANSNSFAHYVYSDRQVGGTSIAIADPASPLGWSCRLRSEAPYPYCGYELRLDRDGDERGIALSDYHRVSLLISYTGPAETLRLDLKNADPRYSVEGQGETFKFNTVEFATRSAPQLVHFDISDFTVADWWLRARRIPPELSAPQFDNIVALAIQTGSDADIGVHRFQIHEISFEGAALSRAELYLGLLAIWIIFAGAFLLYRMVNLKRDIAERKAAEARTELLQNQLIHVSRVSAMGEMASALAHELNQPLVSVASYMAGIRRLLSSDKADAQARAIDALGAAEDATLRAGDIIRRLRELVSGKVQRSDEDLSELIRQVGMIAFIDAELHGITPTIDIDENCRWVDVDKVQIQQVVLNLVRNSIQAMEQQPDRRLGIRTRCAGEMVEVSVSDNGPGIPDAVRDSLFTAFRTTKPGGMGIGLSISRTIVEAHGGNIWMKDAEGGGTIFTFSIPASASPAPNPRKKALPFRS